MTTLKSLKSIVLLSTLSLLSLPGCQGVESTAQGPENTPGSSTQELGCYGSLVPTMTGPSTPSGSVTRSGAYGTSYEAWQAFDGNTSSMWLSALNQTPAWIDYEWFNGARTVTRYALTYANGTITTRAPMNWTLQGWNGTAWVVVDTRTNQINWAGFERREFAVASPGAYSKYRLNITDDNDTRTGIVVVSLGHLELIGCGPEAKPIWTRYLGTSGAETRTHDLTGDPAGRTYSTGMTNGALNGGAMVGVLDAFLHARDWSGGTLFYRQIGVPGTLTLGYGVAQNQTFEEIYVAGFTDGGLDGNTRVGSRDFFVTKYRYTGVRQWTRQFGAPGKSTEGYGVAVDASSNAYVVGSTNGALDGNALIGNYDTFVTKYDAAGNKLWTRTLGAAGTTTHGRRAAVDGSGNVYVAGWTTANLDGNVRTGVQDFFVTKYSAAGVKQWTRQLGASGAEAFLYGAAADASGNVYVTGYTGGGLDGNPAGSGIGTFLVKYDTAGNKQWSRQFGTGSGAWGTGLVVNAAGVFVSGSGEGDVSNPSNTMSTTAHTYIAKFDTAGNRQWVYQQGLATLSGTSRDMYSNGLSIDQNGNFFLGGYTNGNYDGNTLAGSADAFVTKLPAQ